MSKLVIIGDSLFAEVALECFSEDSPYEVVAFAVEAQYREREELMGYPVVDLEKLTTLYPPSEHSVHVAVPYTMINQLRARLVEVAKSFGYPLASYISSKAFIASSVRIGSHAFIFEDNTVQPYVVIGENCVLWSGNHVGHHSRIHSNVFVSSHVVISGNVTVDEYCFLGVNCTLVNDICVGRQAWVGPGALVTRSVEPDTVLRAARAEVHEKSTTQLFGLD